ncbi:MAG: hypothetical protein AAB276_04985, partial [Pseudomonadota bacterium]
MDKHLYFFYWPAQNLSDNELQSLMPRLSAVEQKAFSSSKSLKRQFEVLRGRALLRTVFRKLYNFELPNKLPVSASGKPLE